MYSIIPTVLSPERDNTVQEVIYTPYPIGKGLIRFS